jgi:hypothetical protein
MNINELGENYKSAMRAYLEEVQKTHTKAVDRDTGFSEQLKQEEEAEKRYRKAQQAFIRSTGGRGDHRT